MNKAEAVKTLDQVKEKTSRSKESDERGEKVVAVKGGVVAKVTVTPMKLKG